MKILCSTTYYHPHISGLTVVAQNIAEGLATRGHTVSVLTSHYDRLLPPAEVFHGVNIVRIPVLCRLSKGPIMPSYVHYALKLIKSHDVVLTHLPTTLLEVLAFSLAACLIRVRPIIVVHNCDVQLPTKGLNTVINAAVSLSSAWMARCADEVVTHSDDYAAHSRVLHRLSGRITYIPPPVDIPKPRPREVEMIRSRYISEGGYLVGYVGRWAAEKGLEYLLQALSVLRKEFPDIKVLFAGKAVAVGEEHYRKFILSQMQEVPKTWELLGSMNRQELADFYSACDVVVLPSINITESFGLVQVESMLCGTPVVASDLPGVRIPIQTTGMGRLVPCHNPESLAQAITAVIRDRCRYEKPREEIERHFSQKTTIDRYESLLDRLVRSSHKTSITRAPSLPSADSHKLETLRSGQGRSSKDVFNAYLTCATPFHALVRSIEHRIMRQTGPLEGPLLDLGCGDGLFASLLLSEPPLAGMDTEFSYCREARSRKAHSHVIVGSAVAMPLPSSYFRTVIANCVIEHIPDIDAALSETCRILQPGGRFFFGVPSDHFGEMLFFSSHLKRLGLKKWGPLYGEWFNRHSRHFHIYNPDIWRKILARNGFRVEHWEYYLTSAGLRAFDLAHYISLPHLLSKKMTGRWAVFPLTLANPLFEKWLRPHSEENPMVEKGAYLFFNAQKVMERKH